MMMLELEYFFLCSEQGVTSHSPQRAGPTAPGTGGTGLPGWATGRAEWRRGMLPPERTQGYEM